MSWAHARFWAAFGATFLFCATVTVLFAYRLGYAPDEGNHLAMVKHHAETLELATWETWPYGSQRGHAYQLFSPLPYVFHVPFYILGKALYGPRMRGRIKIVTRLGGLVIAFLQLLVTLRLAELFFERWESLLAAAAINLIPQLRYIHAYVNADAASILCASVAALLVAYLIVDQRPATLPMAVVTGLTLAGLAHSKYNAGLIAVVLFATFAVRAFQCSQSWRVRYRLLGIATVLPTLLAGWFQLHVYTELGNGHILAGKDHLALMASTFYGVSATESTSWAMRAARVSDLWASIWGDFAHVGILPGAYLTVLTGIVFAACGSLVYVALRAKEPAQTRRTAFLGLGIGTCTATWLALALQPALVIQGRLLLPYVVFLLAPIWASRELAPHRLRIPVLLVWPVLFLCGTVLMTRQVLAT